MATSDMLVGDASALQLELDLGDGTRVPVSFDLPVEQAEDGSVRKREKKSAVAWISTATAGTRLGISEDTVRKHILAGRIQGGRFGRNFKANALHVDQLRDQILAGENPLGGMAAVKGRKVRRSDGL